MSFSPLGLTPTSKKRPLPTTGRRVLPVVVIAANLSSASWRNIHPWMQLLLVGGAMTTPFGSWVRKRF
jgi:hypothetical protein